MQEARYYEYENASIVNIILFRSQKQEKERVQFNKRRKNTPSAGLQLQKYVTASKCFKPFTKLHEVATVILPLRPEERRVSRLVPIIILQSESETRRKADRDPKLL